MTSLKNKVLFITGASRGIGHAIALRAARDGARIVIAAKTTEEHPKLPGTIYTAAKEIREAGGEALPLKVDIRDENEIEAAVEKTIKEFGGIDILINNASAISLTGTLKTPMKKFDLMWGVNARGTYATSQACIPHLLKSNNPHILMLSPPLSMQAKWFQNHCAYTISKYGMSMCVLGMAAEFQDSGIGVNALWPRTTIATSAVEMLGGEALMKASRKPTIVADAAYWILTQPSAQCSGNFFIDDDILTKSGVDDLSAYAVSPNKPLVPDFFLD